MALSYSVIRQGVDVFGSRTVEADVTFDSSYPTNGEPVVLAEIGLARVDAAELVYRTSPDGTASAGVNHGIQIVPIVTDVYAPLLKIFTAADTEAANASDQSAVVQRIRFVGA